MTAGCYKHHICITPIKVFKHISDLCVSDRIIFRFTFLSDISLICISSMKMVDTSDQLHIRIMRVSLRNKRAWPESRT